MPERKNPRKSFRPSHISEGRTVDARLIQRARQRSGQTESAQVRMLHRQAREALAARIERSRKLRERASSLPPLSQTSTSELFSLAPVIEDCAICLEPKLPSDDLRMLGCKHIFHSECINPWVKRHGTCVTCRTPLYPELHYDDYYDRQAEDYYYDVAHYR